MVDSKSTDKLVVIKEIVSEFKQTLKDQNIGLDAIESLEIGWDCVHDVVVPKLTITMRKK